VLRRLAVALALATTLLACRGSATEPPEIPVSTPTDNCDTTVEATDGALRTAIDAADDGAVLCLKPGTHRGSHPVSRSVTIRALGDGVVLDANGEGPVLGVLGDKLNVELHGLTLTGGEWEAGGAIGLESRSTVTLIGCTLRGNKTGEYGGGALFARRGTVVLKDCLIEDNEGKWGGALLADGVSTWRVSGTTIRGNRGARGAVAVREDAEVTLTGCTIADNTVDEGDGAQIYVSGTATEGPTIVLDGTDATLHDALGNAEVIRK